MKTMRGFLFPGGESVFNLDSFDEIPNPKTVYLLKSGHVFVQSKASEKETGYISEKINIIDSDIKQKKRFWRRNNE